MGRVVGGTLPIFDMNHMVSTTSMCIISTGILWMEALSILLSGL